jgi:hypothetical protein
VTSGNSIIINDRGFSRLNWIKSNGNCWIPLDFNHGNMAFDLTASFEPTMSAGCVLGSSGSNNTGRNALVVKAIETGVSWEPITSTTKDGTCDLYDKEGNIKVLDDNLNWVYLKHYEGELIEGFNFDGLGEKYFPGVTYSKDENNKFTSIAFTFPEIRATGEVGDPYDDDCFQFHFPVKPSYSMKDFMGSFWVRDERFMGIPAWKMVNESRQFILWVDVSNGHICLADVSGKTDQEVLDLNEDRIRAAKYGSAGCVNKGRIMIPTYKTGKVITGWKDHELEYQVGATDLPKGDRPVFNVFDGGTRHYLLGETQAVVLQWAHAVNKQFTYDGYDNLDGSFVIGEDTMPNQFVGIPWDIEISSKFPTYIFAKNVGNAPAEMISGMTLRRLRFGTGNPVHDLIPVESSGTVGLFDTITNKFYPIQGSGYTYG